MANESKTRDCPFCKEEIKVDAIKCKHCGSSVAPEKPAHEGNCPYCKEKIHPEAIKCKHCKSNLSSRCNCEDRRDRETPMALMKSKPPFGRIRPDFGGMGFSEGNRCCCNYHDPIEFEPGRWIDSWTRVCVSCPAGDKCDCSPGGPYCIENRRFH